MDNRFINAPNLNSIKKMERIQKLKTYGSVWHFKALKRNLKIDKQNARKKPKIEKINKSGQRSYIRIWFRRGLIRKNVVNWRIVRL